MKLRLIFGIILPAVVIILLTVLSSLDVGFSVEKSYVKGLSITDMFNGQTLKSSIDIGDVKFSNEYFMPKRYELPAMFGCLVDDAGIQSPQNAGYVSYSEGDASYGDNGYYGPSYYGGRTQDTSVEISAGQSKSVKIYFHPEGLDSYSYDSNKTAKDVLLEKYGDYDSLVLVENSLVQDSYGSCYSVTPAQLQAGRKISLK